MEGVFTWVVEGSYTYALLLLSDQPVTCQDILVTGDYPTGIYEYLYPVSDPEPVWVADYTACGDLPCFYSYWYTNTSGEEFTDGHIAITAYDDHYITAAWDHEVSTGEMTFYNCGDAYGWY